MKSLESFLESIHQPIQIVGGSPLIRERTEDDKFWGTPGDYNCFPGGKLPEFAISINGLQPGAYAAAINCGRSDRRRVKNWERVLRPNPQTYLDRAGVITPMMPLLEYLSLWSAEHKVILNKQPTTCFAMMVICDRLKLRAELWGVCGWASKWHDGDLEMHYMKNFMPLATVHDPRPQW